MDKKKEFVFESPEKKLLDDASLDQVAGGIVAASAEANTVPVPMICTSDANDLTTTYTTVY